MNKISIKKKPSTTPTKSFIVNQDPIHSIIPYYQNPRHNENAIPAVAASIREFGFRQPIVIDTDRVIVIGHTRWRAAQTLGFSHVPVHVAHDLSPERIRALRLADNKVGEIAEWNVDFLQAELNALAEVGFDMKQFGDFATPTPEEWAPKEKRQSWLQDFETAPRPKEQFILLSAPYEVCVEIMAYLAAHPEVKAHCSKDTNSKLALKNMGKGKHIG